MARKKLSKNPDETILVVTANEANALYFSQMRKDCRYANMNVDTVLDAKDLHDFINKVARLRNKGGFTDAWAVFDFADFHLDADQVKAEEPFALQKKVKLGWNNPSQALWYLLHFQTPRAFVSDKAAFEQAMEKVVPGYASTAQYFLTDGIAFHISLFSSLSRAANNASLYNTLASVKTGMEATNMVLLINDITRICGKADITHNQRQLGRR